MSDALERMNESPTRTGSGAELTQPRSLSDLRSFLHGYRIKNASRLGRTARASIIISAITDGSGTVYARRAAQELAGLDPSLAWLPGWKPRVSATALAKDDGK